MSKKQGMPKLLEGADLVGFGSSGPAKASTQTDAERPTRTATAKFDKDKPPASARSPK